MVDPGELSIGDVRTAGAPAAVQVELESVNDGIRATTTVEYAWEGRCRRCLGTASGTARISTVDLFVEDPAAYGGSEAHLVPEHEDHAYRDLDDAPEEIDAEIRQLTDGWVDLSGSVRDALLLGLPLAPLCDERCEGPSPEEFPVGLDRGEAAPTPRSTADPRWAALADLRFDQDDS